jgi:hypothetical protein
MKMGVKQRRVNIIIKGITTQNKNSFKCFGCNISPNKMITLSTKYTEVRV